MSDFQKRIKYSGDIKVVLKQVASDFDLGEYKDHSVIEKGYEDFNIIFTTDKDKYFVKIFAEFRDLEGCKRYVDMMLTVLEAGINHPKLFEYTDGFLYERKFDAATVRLSVMEFIEGKTLYDSMEKVSLEDGEFFVQQAGLINKLELEVPPVYDSWAIVNLVKEWEKNRDLFSDSDKELVEPVFLEFKKVDLEKLPVCFVHGDIIKTNVMKDENGELYVLDFSVANNYPRVQELAVLLCNILYNDYDPSNFMDYYNMAVEEYQKVNELTNEEIKILPLYLKAAHAMHIIGAGVSKFKDNNEAEENEYWLEQGRKGLRDMNKLFK